MTIIINLFGGPGTGKSTAATGIFSKLKRADILTEYVNEYAKEIVWEETTALLQNQLHIFAEQFRRQWRLIGKVDYIITDSPLLLSYVYFKHYHRQLQTPIFTDKYVTLSLDYYVETFKQFNNVNFFINRKKKYVEKGRTQTEAEAKQIDYEILEVLKDHNLPFIETDSINSISDVVNYVLLGK